MHKKFIRVHRKFLVLYAVIKTVKNWPLVLASAFFGTPPPKFLFLRNGRKFLLPNKLNRTELSFFSEIWFERVYNPIFFIIHENDTVFDIGANVGYFSVFAAQRAKRVFSFEPVPEIYKRLKENIRANGLGNITPANAAAANLPGKTTIHFAPTNNGSHSLFNVEGANKSAEVETINLEQFCESRGIGRIDFLKMDCEGAEYEIILNMSDAMLAKIKKIAMEYHDNINEHKHGELVKFLEEKGFLVEERDELYIYAINIHSSR